MDEDEVRRILGEPQEIDPVVPMASYAWRCCRCGLVQESPVPVTADEVTPCPECGSIFVEVVPA